MGTTRKKGDLQWQALVRRKGFPTQSKTFLTKRDAEAWCATVESEMLRGVFVSRVVAERTTLREALERFALEVSPTHKGYALEVGKLRMLGRFPIAARFLATLQPSDFAKFRDERLKTKAPATVLRDLALLHRVFEVGRKEWGFNIDNPVSMVEKPKVRNERSRRLAPDEETKLLRELELNGRSENGQFERGGVRNPWVKPVVQFALHTAMRRGEMLGLRWRDVDLERRVAVLHDTKNGDTRRVPLSTGAVALLRGLPRSIDGRVFPISVEALKQSFEGARARAGLVDFRFHDLRHEAIVRLSRKLPNTIELSAVSGHRDPKMLKRYYNVTAEELAAKLG
jgi:integrase